MWPFRRYPPLTNRAYGLWIEAMRPPFDWFMRQNEQTQEALAAHGTEYVAEVCVAIGKAVADPWVVEAGLDADTNPESEEVLVKRLAAQMVQERLSGHQQSPPLTMGGVTERRQKSQQAAQSSNGGPKTFLGRKPDKEAP